MKKLFNLRQPVLYAAAFAVGSVCAVAAAYFNLSGFWLFLPSGILFLVCSAVGLKVKKTSAFFICLVATLMFAVAALYSYIVISSLVETEAYIDGAVTVAGTVEEVSLTSSGTRYIVLSDVSFDGENVGGKLIAYLLDTAEGYCRKGYTVSFYTEPEKLSAFSDGWLSYLAVKHIKYECVIAGTISYKYAFSFFGQINYAIENALFSALSEESASVCFAMLTGNTDYISSATLGAFRYGGIAHIFAVSGLHIGVIYGAISVLFKRIRVNKYVATVIKIAFIATYAGVCNFSSSSVRAVVMCSFLALAGCIHRKYDSFNALSVSALILLLIDPLSMFGAGFILSFGAMFGIVVLSNSFSRIFAFLPNKLKSSVSVGWAAQTSTTPLMAVLFGNISFVGLFLNLVFIPIVSALYVLMFVLVLLSAISPFDMGFLVSAGAAPMELIINLVNVCGFENAIIYTDFDAFFILPFALFMAGLSDKFNIRPYVRGMLAGFSVIAVFCTATFPVYGNGAAVTFSSCYDGGYAFIQSPCGSVLVVSQDVSGVPEYALQTADALVIAGGDDSYEALFTLSGGYKEVYMKKGLGEINALGSYALYYETAFTVCGVDFLYSGDTLYMQIGGVLFSYTIQEKGVSYGDLPEDCAVNMYNYGIYPSVLVANGKEYDLSLCGAQRFIFGNGKICAPVILYP